MEILSIALIAVLASFKSTASARQPRPFIVEDPPQTPDEQLKQFHLPLGFKIELVAAEPELINPINLNFDAAGRLLVSHRTLCSRTACRNPSSSLPPSRFLMATLSLNLR